MLVGVASVLVGVVLTYVGVASVVVDVGIAVALVLIDSAFVVEVGSGSVFPLVAITGLTI